jgi:hypothetical protein
LLFGSPIITRRSALTIFPSSRWFSPVVIRMGSRAISFGLPIRRGRCRILSGFAPSRRCRNRSLPALFLTESQSLFSLISPSIKLFKCPARYAVKFANNSCNCFRYFDVVFLIPKLIARDFVGAGIRLLSDFSFLL